MAAGAHLPPLPPPSFPLAARLDEAALRAGLCARQVSMAQHTKWRRLSAPSGDSSARQVAIPHRSAARNERRRQRYDSVY
eukprot:140594-Prorocentrum_minimum.AAC.1